MNNRKTSLPVALAAVIVIAGCAPARTRAPMPETAALARSESVAALRAWSFTGRIAVSFAGRAGTGHIDWRQDGPFFVIAVRAPIAGQSWQISGDSSMAQIDGLGPEPRLGPDADSLLQREVGWTLPLAAVRDWIRGVPHGPGAQVRRDADGRPLEMADLGWRIEFRAWQPPVEGLPELPQRIIARRGEDDVRVSISEWRAGSGD